MVYIIYGNGTVMAPGACIIRAVVQYSRALTGVWRRGAGSSPASTTFHVLAARAAPPSIIVACVISSLPSARLSPEGSRLLSYLCICILYCPLPYLRA
jgi:hypothetical protein